MNLCIQFLQELFMLWEAMSNTRYNVSVIRYPSTSKFVKKKKTRPRLVCFIYYLQMTLNLTPLIYPSFPDSPMFMLFVLKRCMSYLSIFLRQFFFLLITYFTRTYVFYNLTMRKVTIWGHTLFRKWNEAWSTNRTRSTHRYSSADLLCYLCVSSASRFHLKIIL